MRNAWLIGLCISLASLMSGCASIVSGTNQPVTVETRAQGTLVSGANCKLVNDKGTWYVTTPGSVVVHRSLAELKLSCEKDGGAPGLANVKSTTKAMAFGNAVFGGLIGVGVDVASGAAFDYPDLIKVEMGSIAGVSSIQPSSSVIAVTSPAAPSPGVSNAVLSSSLTTVQTIPNEPSAPYPRTLSGPEIIAHFKRHNQLEMEKTKTPFVLNILENGKVERECLTCGWRNGQHATGSMDIKSAEGLVCFNWPWTSYPSSGCYRVEETSKNEFSINDDLAKLHYNYAVPSQ